MKRSKFHKAVQEKNVLEWFELVAWTKKMIREAREQKVRKIAKFGFLVQNKNTEFRYYCQQQTNAFVCNIWVQFCEKEIFEAKPAKLEWKGQV